MANGFLTSTASLLLLALIFMAFDVSTKASSEFWLLETNEIGSVSSQIRVFRERVFPSDSTSTRMAYGSRPYDTISLGIRTLAKHLWNDLPQGQKAPVRTRISLSVVVLIQ